MSAPWKFFGTWFPTIPGVILASNTGPGTGCPLIWTRVDGNTGDDQMCQFEWTTKTVRFQVAGTIQLEFFDYTGGGAPSEVHSAAFSIDCNENYITDPTWDTLQPGGTFALDNHLVGGTVQTYNFSGADSVPITLPWGPDNFSITCQIEVGTDVSLSAVDGSAFTQYAKTVRVTIQAQNDNHSPTAQSSATLLTDITSAPTTPAAEVSIDPCFHGTGATAVPLYGSSATNTPPNYFTLSTRSLTVDAKLTTPPPI